MVEYGWWLEIIRVLKVKVYFQIHLAYLKAKACKVKAFSCSAVLIPQHYQWHAVTLLLIRLLQWTTSRVDNNGQRSKYSLVGTTLVISACWRLMHVNVKSSHSRDSNPQPVDPNASMHNYITAPNPPCLYSFTLTGSLHLHCSDMNMVKATLWMAHHKHIRTANYFSSPSYSSVTSIATHHAINILAVTMTLN